MGHTMCLAQPTTTAHGWENNDEADEASTTAHTAAKISVKLRTESSLITVDVDPSAPVYDSVRAEFGLDEDEDAEVNVTLAGEHVVDDGSSFQSHGIDDGSTLCVHFSFLKEWWDPVGEEWPGERKLRERFKDIVVTWDLDGDGVISGLELSQAFEKMQGMPVTVEEQLQSFRGIAGMTVDEMMEHFWEVYKDDAGEDSWDFDDSVEYYENSLFFNRFPLPKVVLGSCPMAKWLQVMEGTRKLDPAFYVNMYYEDRRYDIGYRRYQRRLAEQEAEDAARARRLTPSTAGFAGQASRWKESVKAQQEFYAKNNQVSWSDLWSWCLSRY